MGPREVGELRRGGREEQIVKQTDRHTDRQMGAFVIAIHLYAMNSNSSPSLRPPPLSLSLSLSLSLFACSNIPTCILISVCLWQVFGFFNMLVWLGNLWFLYKETPWFKVQSKPQTVGTLMQGLTSEPELDLDPHKV